MEHLDKLIALAILGAVAVFLLFVLRRLALEERADRSPTDVVTVEPAAPLAIEAPPPIVPAEIPKTIEPPPAPVLPSPVVVVKPKRKRKRAIPVSPIVIPAAATPIVTVLDLLKKKDALATAFLLREILAPPVAKR